MIDTHAHLDFKDFDEDREEVIQRAFDNGPAHIASQNEAGRVRAIINVGVDIERSRKSVEIAEAHENIFASVGIHPEYFSDQSASIQGSTSNSRFDLSPPDVTSGFLKVKPLVNSLRSNLFEELKELAKNEKVVAIGEAGLDYFRVEKPDFSRENPVSVEEIKEDQKAGFIAQIEIAREFNLPVIVHCREAWSDLYEIISKIQPSNQGSTFLPPTLRRGSSRSNPQSIPQGQTFFVLHCYSGEKKDTEKFLELPNIYFSFSGNITYPKPTDRAEKLAEAVRMVPLERMMLDSDCPFLSPQEFRGKRNEPAYVRYIAEKIADLKEISVEEAERKTDENAEKFFGIGQ